MCVGDWNGWDCDVVWVGVFDDCYVCLFVVEGGLLGCVCIGEVVVGYVFFV